jgi:transposase InsO family protein
VGSDGAGLEPVSNSEAVAARRALDYFSTPRGNRRSKARVRGRIRQAGPAEGALLQQVPCISPADQKFRPRDEFALDEVSEAIGHLGIEPRRTAYRSPWKNGMAERRVGCARRELLDHVIVPNEQHLQRLLREYVDYYNADRVHTRLRDSPIGRPTENRRSADAQIVGLPRVGGLRHRYAWREAA